MFKLILFSFTLFSFFDRLYAYDTALSLVDLNNNVKLTMELVQQCHPGMKSSFLFTDLISNSFSINYYSNMIGGVVAFNDSVHVKKMKKVPFRSIVMVLSSATKVNQVLEKESWRNFNQFFVILEGGDNGCNNAQLFLMEAWKNDILDVIFICFDYRDKIQKIYSFNPFSNFAPLGWKKISVVPAVNNHSWTLFSLNYNTETVKCPSLFFKKTNNLAGYTVKSGLFSVPPFVTYEVINGTPAFGGYDYTLMKLLMENMNGSLNIKFNESVTSPGTFAHISDRGLLGQVATGQIDLILNSLFLREISSEAELIYPFQASGVSVITQQRYLKTFGSELFMFLPLSIVTLFFAMSALIFILLRVVFNDPYSRYFIDILRVHLNLVIPRLPLTTGGRIVFSATIISFMIANIVVQANMNTVLTLENTARNVEALEDLEDMGYIVITRSFTSPLLKSHHVRNVKEVNDNINCSMIDENEAFAARNIILRTLITDNCHIPKKPIISGIYSTYYTRHNWPLYSAVNNELMNLFESGLTDYILKKTLRSYQKLMPKEVDRYQVITLDHLKYFIYFFIIGMCASIIVFFVELYTSQQSRKLESTFIFVN